MSTNCCPAFFMGEGRARKGRDRRWPLILLLAGGGGALACPTAAMASDVALAIIGPHEYDLPVDFRPFNVFVQYGEWNNDRSQWTDEGHKAKGPGTDTFVGLSKYVHFWTFKGLPNVGFAYEVIVPEVRIEGHARGAGGIGDPLTGPALWIKPTANSTLGFQTFLQVPVGGRQVTSNYWANLSSLFYDLQLKRLSVTGNTGFIFRGTRHAAGLPDLEKSTIFQTNLRVGLKAAKHVEPFVGVDYQTMGADRLAATHDRIAGSASHELAFGAGSMVSLSDKASLTLRYSRGVDGKNTPVTDAVYFKFGYVW